ARADALRVPGVEPEAVLGDVARAAQLDRQGRTVVARHGHGHAVAVEGGGVDVAVEPLAAPQLLAGLRVEASEETGPGPRRALPVAGVAQEELVLAVDLDDQRRAPRAVGLVLLPHRLAGLLVDGEQEVTAFAVVRAAP